MLRLSANAEKREPYRGLSATRVTMGRKNCSIALVFLALTTGCTETGKLRLDGQIAQSQSALTAGSSAQSLTLGEGALVISRARISVSEIELEGGEEEDELEAEMGPAVIDLNLDGAPTQVAVADVEAGRYHTLGLEFATRTWDGQKASILVDGSYEGTPFAFRSAWTPEAEFPLSPEVAVPANGEATAGVTFDVASWFSRADGTVIDPTDAASQEAIEGRVMASISAAAAIESGEDDD
jgi:hypothetical protein